jgi:hypothetical protein
MARLYSNENFPFPSAEELRRLGHDVLTIQEAGQSNQAMSEESVLAFAHSTSRALLTLNRKHFIRLHKQNNRHSGIIACTFDPDFLRLAQRIHIALHEQPDLSSQLVRINRPPR